MFVYLPPFKKKTKQNSFFYILDNLLFFYILDNTINTKHMKQKI